MPSARLRGAGPARRRLGVARGPLPAHALLVHALLFGGSCRAPAESIALRYRTPSGLAALLRRCPGSSLQRKSDYYVAEHYDL